MRSTIRIRHILKAKCPICNHTFEASYCPSCGLPISRFLNKDYSKEGFHPCGKCYTPNPNRARYCRNCGEKFNYINKHCYIDLGLSVLWSTETIEGLYLWMCTENMLNSNCDDRILFYKEIEGKDTATYKWGNKWRIPTKEDFEELIEKCHWEAVSIYIPEINRNKNALKITGPNGKYILLPTTGYVSDNFWEGRDNTCVYWTSTERISPQMRAAYSFHYGIRDSTLSSERKASLWDTFPFIKNEQLISPHSKRTPCAIRPVTDKKWQEKQ